MQARLAWTTLVAVAALAPAPAARADQPAAPQQAPSHRELNIIPIAGGDSDVGLGFGEVADWARVEGGHPQPYKWKLENGAFITFNEQAGGLVIPFQDYYFLMTWLDLGPQHRTRLDVRPAFTDERTLKYYGIGNASQRPPDSVDIRETEYRRMHPTLLVEARSNLGGHWYALLGNVYTQNWVNVPPNSILAHDIQFGTPEVKSFLRGFGPHAVDLIELAIQYDSRDSEIVTRRGMYHFIEARLSPAVPGWLPYAYIQLDAAAQFYVTAIPRWLTIAWRGVADVMMGDPPTYELARFDETPALGGSKAVRGVPAQRYYGKVKLFENLEARSELLPFKVGKKSLVLGVAAFLDGGRTWSEIGQAHPDLDGTGWGLKYGIGAGLRLQEGQTFVVRADLAWSPDAQPVGAYFAAGQIF
ncbi:MAG: BamA/TamA family outer membrane protein [Verrucomicrobiota bacterium]